MTAIINPGGTPSSELPAIPTDYLKPGAPSPVGGSYVIVIDPSKFGPLTAVKEKADQYIRAIKGGKKRPGVEEIYTPDEWGLKKVYRERVPKWRSWKITSLLSRDLWKSTGSVTANWKRSGMN